MDLIDYLPKARDKSRDVTVDPVRKYIKVTHKQSEEVKGRSNKCSMK